MCTVSAVHQQVGPFIEPARDWGTPLPGLNPAPYQLPFPTPLPRSLDADILKEIRDVLPRLDRIDKALGLKDCSAEEEAKAAFRKRLDELIAAAEAMKSALS